MAAVSKSYGIDDTVFVHYKNSSLQWLPRSRTIKNVDTKSSGNSAVVHFTDGEPVTDVSGAVTVYTTQILCAAAITDWVIAQSAAVVALDTTTSAVSTAGQASITLGRIS